jgi:hypothetical protein
MFLLRRLIARGSRALGVMLGTSCKGAGHALCGGAGDPDDATLEYLFLLSLQSAFPAFPPIFRRTGSTPGIHPFLKKEIAWTAEIS